MISSRRRPTSSFPRTPGAILVLAPLFSLAVAGLTACGSDGTGGAGGSGSTGGSGGQAPPICTPGAVIDCPYPGAAGTEGKGPCKAGKKTCDAMGTSFGACEGEVVPAAEICDNELDDDCNGAVNDACPCTPGAKQACYSGSPATKGIGICHAGEQMCSLDGIGYGACIGEQIPQLEDCSQPTDDDCDGEVLDADAGCVCLPSTTKPCYSGPDGTAGVGLCKGGTTTCAAAGTAWGACAGEVTPQPEVCSQPEDEDCSGHACAEPLWALLTGQGGDESAVDIALDSQGNTLVLGTFTGTITLDAVTLANQGYADTFLLKLDPAGHAIWGRRFGGDPAGYMRPMSLAVDASGAVLIAVDVKGTVDFGGGLEPAGSDEYEDAFAVKIDATGTFVWSRRFDGAGQQTIRDVAVDATGDVYIAGDFNPAIDLGSGPVAAVGYSDPFLARLGGATGATVWGKVIPVSASSNAVTNIAVDPAGDLVVFGYLGGTIDLGGGGLSPVSQFASSYFLGKLDNQGKHKWSTVFAKAITDLASELAVDAQGGIAVAAMWYGNLNLGGSYDAGALGNLFAAKFAPAGAHQWTKAFTAQFNQALGGLAAGPSGEVVVSLSSLETIDFGDGPLPPAGSYDAFLGKLGANGAAAWGRRYGSSSKEDAGPVAIGPSGDLVFAVHAPGKINFGTGDLVVSGAHLAIARLAP